VLLFSCSILQKAVGCSAKLACTPQTISHSGLVVRSLSTSMQRRKGRLALQSSAPWPAINDMRWAVHMASINTDCNQFPIDRSSPERFTGCYPNLLLLALRACFAAATIAFVSLYVITKGCTWYNPNPKCSKCLVDLFSCITATTQQFH
jgi:hypothetical protein